MDPEALHAVEAITGHRFRDPSLVELALTHASASNSRLASNERLEFLGDAILGAIVCEQIFRLFPDLLEGQMTKIKSTAVSRRTCATIAGQIGLERFIVLGKGMLTHDQLPSSLAAAVLESVVAALYLDAGYEATRAFVAPLFEPLILEAERSGHQQNFKSVLQQHAQQTLSETPTYRIVDERGPDHAKSFLVAVELSGVRHEASWGNSKKQAEQLAALNALRELGLIESTDDGEHVLVEAGAPSEAGDLNAGE